MIRMLPIAMLALLLQSCDPWTVRPIEGEKTAASPAQNAASIWSSKLIPAITHSAVDARVLLDALTASPENARAKYGPAYFMMKGEGVVIGVNTSSRTGLATIDLAGSRAGVAGWRACRRDQRRFDLAVAGRAIHSDAGNSLRCARLNCRACG